MAVKIRMTRMGTTNTPFFRVVAVDSKAPRDGACIEFLGWYDPKNKKRGKDFSLKLDRIEYWLKNGAQISDTVRSLVKKAGKGVDSADASAVPEAAQAVEQAPAQEVAASEPVVQDEAPAAKQDD